MKLSRPATILRLLVLLPALFAAQRARAQETVFDVPSADILDRGKVYGGLDGTARPVNPIYTFTPRVVLGIGHQIEIGMNFDGLTLPVTGELELSPTAKWRLWNHPASGLSFFVGDDLFFPVRQRTYNSGNYSYAAFAKQWKHGTRVSLGAYDFTKNVVASANRAGGQFTFEQSVTTRLTLAAEWYTGNNATGYFNPGVIFKLTPKLTGYAAYQIGNAGVTKGNHQFLWELGYNFN
ncbi:MAG TPA: hypothetical protein VJN93_07345 [Candidatus Acidoferrum sp.]|nr:hypothetical protein [Candidatus Acidoferrum sp.]